MLFEHGDEPAESLATEQLFGYTDNYIRVAIPYDRNLFNSIETVQLGHINADGHVDCTITQIATEAERHCNLTTANSR